MTQRLTNEEIEQLREILQDRKNTDEWELEENTRKENNIPTKMEIMAAQTVLEYLDNESFYGEEDDISEALSKLYDRKFAEEMEDD